MLFQFAQRRKYYYLLSLAVIIPGIIAMIYSTISTGKPVRLSIDFTGGSLMEVSFVKNLTEQQVRDGLDNAGVNDFVVQRLDPLSSSEIDFKTNEAGSRFDITLPNNDRFDELKAFLQDESRLGAFWSPSTTSDDPTREGALGVRTLPSGQVVMDVSFINAVTQDQVQAALTEFGITDFKIEQVSTQAGSRWQIRMEETDLEQLKGKLQQTLGAFWTPDPNDPDSVVTSSSVSATVGKEVTRSAILATLAVAVIILGFIVFAFRQVPHAVRYGACAIIAMFHDILVTMGVMSILGLIFGWEVDALFLTAILTVVGYSVQDTIVVFDRIRENITRYRGEEFDMIVNRSVLETIHRSLATQLNAVFVMIAILLFGGETIRHFIAILLIGLMSGTYSSLFNAVPLLISWEKGEIPFVNREAKKHRREEAAAASS